MSNRLQKKLQLLKLLIAAIMTVQGHYMFLGNFSIVYPLKKGKVRHPLKSQAKTKNEDIASSVLDDVRSFFILIVTLE